MVKEACVIEATAVVDNRIFFTDNKSNCLFEYLSEYKKLDFVGQFDSENPTGENLFERSCVKDGIIAFIPRQADSICFYNTNTEEMNSEKLPDELVGRESKFRTGIWADDSIYLFGGLVDAVWKYSISNSSFVKLCTYGSEEGAFFEDCIIKDDKIYAINIKTPILLELDMKTDRISEHTITGIQNGFDYIVKADDRLFLLPYKGDMIVEFDISTKDSKTFSIGENVMDWGIGGGVIKNNELIIYRKCDEPLIAIDVEDYKKRYIKFDIRDVCEISGRSFKSFNRPIICEGKVMCSIQKTGWILENENGCYRWIKPEMVDSPSRRWQFKFEDVSYIEEQPFFGLDGFIDSLKKC